MIEVLAGIADPIEQDHFVNEVAALLGARSESIRGLLRRRTQRKQPSQPRPASTSAEQARPEPLDDYLLALLIRLREKDPSFGGGDLEFLRPESRALAGSLGGSIPPELEAYAGLAKRYLADVQRLSDTELAREFDRTRLDVKREVLERQKRAINALRVDAEIRGHVDQLDSLARAMNEIDQQLSPDRESAGTR
jgi:hypothetical protein